MTGLEWTEKPIEGDYIETHEGFLFTVKGMKHPEGLVIAYLRYLPDLNGDRIRDGRCYTRAYSIKETTDYLSEYYPRYLNYIDSLGLTLQSLPEEVILRVYKPREYLQKVFESPSTHLDEICTRFVAVLSDRSGVSLNHFGISGSQLIGLDTPSSDIDLNVYGETECIAVYKALKSLREETDWVIPYNSQTISTTLESRWGGTGLDLSLFREIEMKKLLHGQISRRDYFIRMLKPEKNEETSKPVGAVKIRGFITEDDPIFTPCSYCFTLTEYIDPVIGPEVTELVSYRGRFTEQAETGSHVEVYGSLEEVTRDGNVYHRVILGGPRDYILPVSLIDR